MKNKQELAYIERIETYRTKSETLPVAKIRFIISIYSAATNRVVMTYGQFKTYDDAVQFAAERHIDIE